MRGSLTSTYHRATRLRSCRVTQIAICTPAIISSNHPLMIFHERSLIVSSSNLGSCSPSHLSSPLRRETPSALQASSRVSTRSRLPSTRISLLLIFSWERTRFSARRCYDKGAAKPWIPVYSPPWTRNHWRGKSRTWPTRQPWNGGRFRGASRRKCITTAAKSSPSSSSSSFVVCRNIRTVHRMHPLALYRAYRCSQPCVTTCEHVEILVSVLGNPALVANYIYIYVQICLRIFKVRQENKNRPELVATNLEQKKCSISRTHIHVNVCRNL